MFCEGIGAGRGLSETRRRLLPLHRLQRPANLPGHPEFLRTRNSRHISAGKLRHGCFQEVRAQFFFCRTFTTLDAIDELKRHYVDIQIVLFGNG